MSDGRMMGHPDFVEIKEISKVDLITSKGGKTIGLSGKFVPILKEKKDFETQKI